MSPDTKPSKRHAAPADGKVGPEGSSSQGGSKSGGIGRAIRLLDLLASDGPLRFAELEELSQIPKATLHRLINELAQERMVQYDTRAMTWSAGYRVLEMANRIWTRSDIRMLTRDQLLALNALSGETVQLAVLADTHVIVIDHVESTRSVRHSTIVGAQDPVYCTAAGKVLLAWCDEKRKRDIIKRISFARFTLKTITDRRALNEELRLISEKGFAIDSEERFIGSCSISAPVVDSLGNAIAGLSITAPAFRTSEKDLHEWRDSLVRAAAEVSRRLAPRTGAPIDSPH